MIENIRGDNLENKKTKHRLRKNYEREKPDWIIFIRDLDGLEHETDKIEQRKRYFSNFNSVVDKKGVFLLNIYEIEALLLADIAGFNRFYKVSISFTGNPMQVIQPKEFLASKSNYKQSDTPFIFDQLNFDTVYKRCSYFKDFIENLTNKLN